MRRIWVGLGANLGDATANVLEAMRWLQEAPELRWVRASGLYGTAPWGKTDQPWFVNAVAELETDAPPIAVLDRLLAIERVMGRLRLERWGPRVIDLDYLLDAAATSDTPALRLPHPDMENRAFVLVPLAELRPDLILPSGWPIQARIEELLPSQPLRRLEATIQR